jgi:DNA primase
MMTRDPIPTLDIVRTMEYLGAELPLHIKPHGWTQMRCPIHGGVSCSINPSINRFYCFGCEAKVDGLDLIQAMMGVGLVEAREVATEAGLTTGNDDGRRRGLARKPRVAKRSERRAPERRDRRR